MYNGLAHVNNGIVQPIRLNAHASSAYKYRHVAYRFTLYYVLSYKHTKAFAVVTTFLLHNITYYIYILYI